jgi:hypothetical protein
MDDPAANSGDVKFSIGMLGNIKRATVKRGTTVGEALQQFGFGNLDLKQYTIRGWLPRGNKSREFGTNELNEHIQEDMMLLLPRPIVGRAPQMAEQVMGKLSGVSEVWTERTVDSEGADAMRVVINLDSDAAGAITGGAALDALVQLQNRLHEAAENLPIIIEYATKQEIEKSGS